MAGPFPISRTSAELTGPVDPHFRRPAPFGILPGSGGGGGHLPRQGRYGGPGQLRRPEPPRERTRRSRRRPPPVRAKDGDVDPTVDDCVTSGAEGGFSGELETERYGADARAPPGWPRPIPPRRRGTPTGRSARWIGGARGGAVRPLPRRRRREKGGRATAWTGAGATLPGHRARGPAQSAASGQTGQTGRRGVQIVCPRSMRAAVRSPGRFAGRRSRACPRTRSRSSREPACSGKREDAGEHPFDVGFGGGQPLAERERRHRRRHVFAEAGEGGEDARVARNHPAVVAHDLLRRPPEVSGARVVAETRPRGEDAVLAGAGERREVGKSCDECVVALLDRAHCRLLEHDFGDPDPIRVVRPAPGEAAVFATKPGEELAGERATAHAEGVSDSRGAIQSGSRMRLMTDCLLGGRRQGLGQVLLVLGRRQELAGDRVASSRRTHRSPGGTSCRGRRAAGRPREAAG